jgi:hypothetical protein
MEDFQISSDIPLHPLSEPQGDLYRYVLQASCQSYMLFGQKSESAKLQGLLSERNVSREYLKRSIEVVEQAVKELLKLTQVKTSKGMTRVMKLSCLCLFVFLLLFVVDSYFASSTLLTQVGLWVAVTGLVLQGVVVSGNFPWTRPKSLESNRAQLFRAVVSAIAKINHELSDKHLCFGIETGTLTLSLKDTLPPSVPYQVVNTPPITSRSYSSISPPSRRNIQLFPVMSDNDVKDSKQFKALQRMLESKNELIRTLRQEVDRMKQGASSSDSSVVIG